MSWSRIFTAVLVANIVSWLIISVIGLLFWLFLFQGFSDYVRSAMVSSQLDDMRAADIRLANQYRETIESLPPGKLPPAPKPQKKPTERKRVFSDSAIATNKAVCDFWSRQYRVDQLEESRAYRESACLRYRKSLTLYR